MDPQALRIEIRPNCSLTVRGARAFFFGACIAPFGVGGFLALKGFWPILPFAGLEMVVLAWALKASLERRFHSQTIIVSEGEVSIESRERERCARVVFPRHWAQVKLRRPAASLHPSRLTIESHGRQCELGSFLTEEERRGLALRLTRLIGRVNESPSWQ
ncbi:MAG TPA: DUF2244 domain-containing protein [Steroidobacteraceae bacterium]|jgi:uncharacterized membrane protein|nr:DUF2244 domain-containing protein [Steroidobacteraceae bacterium]